MVPNVFFQNTFFAHNQIAQLQFHRCVESIALWQNPASCSYIYEIDKKKQ